MTKRLFGLAYLILALTTSFLTWRHSDWTVYVGPELRPKFDQPLWFQIATSLLLGAVLSGVVVSLAVTVLFGIRKLRQPCPPSASQR